VKEKVPFQTYFELLKDCLYPKEPLLALTTTYQPRTQKPEGTLFILYSTEYFNIPPGGLVYKTNKEAAAPDAAK